MKKTVAAVLAFLFMFAFAASARAEKKSFTGTDGATYWVDEQLFGSFYSLIRIDPKKTGTTADLQAVDAQMRRKFGDGVDYYLDPEFVLKAFQYPTMVTKIVLPDRDDSPMYNADALSQFTACSTFVMGEEFDYAAQVVDGVLYSGDLTTIYACPPARAGESLAVLPGVVTISDYAFRNARFLKTVTLPKGLKVIGDYAFLNSGLTSISDVTALEYVSATSFIGTPWWNNRPSGSVIVYSGIALAYNGTCPETLTLPSSVKTVGASAFASCNQLRSVKFPSGLKEIGESAFANCGQLLTFTIPSSVISIGRDAFYGTAWWSQNGAKTQVTKDNCLLRVNNPGTSPSALTVASGVRVIADNAFAGCNVSAVTLPASVKAVGYQAFYGCNSLTKLTFNGDCPITWDGDIGVRARNPEIVIQPKAYGWVLDWQNKVLGGTVRTQPSGTGRLVLNDAGGGIFAYQYVYPGQVYPIPYLDYQAYGYSRCHWVNKSTGRAYNPQMLVFGFTAGKDFTLTIADK